MWLLSLAQRHFLHTTEGVLGIFSPHSYIVLHNFKSSDALFFSDEKGEIRIVFNDPQPADVEFTLTVSGVDTLEIETSSADPQERPQAPQEVNHDDAFSANAI